MPVEWPFAQDLIQLGGTGVHKIALEDGVRQQETARAILADLAEQPGIILADEVGMGKTYVALGVIASVLLATRRTTQPVIVMVPPGLASKWQWEWQQFKTLCTRQEALSWVRDAHPRTPTEFFKLLDDPPARRSRLIWLTTNCFSAGLSDPWVKLALIRLARSRTRMDEETKKRLYKWAADLVRLKSKRGLTPALVEILLRAEPTRWHHILVRERILERDEDDPVPEHLLAHQDELDWSELIAVLRGEALPGRRGKASQRRLTEAREDFTEACRDVYEQWLTKAKWHASLLVLDEAHHAKNDETRLAKLFRSEDTTRLLTSKQENREAPLLWNKFDRMLFLTATPFQLGHHELIRVLRSFAAARWSGTAAPVGMQEEFSASMDELENRLDENRLAGRRLDRLWGRLSRENIDIEAADGDLSQAVARWWQRTNLHANDPFEEEILRAVEECRRTKTKAEYDPVQPRCALRTWVIRHNRPTLLPQEDGKPGVSRRAYRYGVAIVQDTENFARETQGLPIAGEETLPFLLAARAQGELAVGSVKARAFFAEGLCSSYEAFHHTRDTHGDARDVDDEGMETNGSAGRQLTEEQSILPVSWYETHIENLIPSNTAPEEERYRHPKIHAVVDRVVRLWLAGEKVLVFCFYRETARALRTHIRREVERATIELAARKLGLDPGHEAEEVRNWFTRIGRRFADSESPFHRELRRLLCEPFFSPEFAILAPRRHELVELLAAYVRSPSFVARYLPLEVSEVREALVEGVNRPHIIHAGVAALSHALTERADDSAMTMLRRWFQVVMGQKFEFDEATSEQLANRVPLPEDLARALTFDLRRVL